MTPKNLEIDGISEISKGKYKHLSVDGEVMVKGDIECKSIDVDGSFKTVGDCLSKRIVIEGEVYSLGTFEAHDIDINFTPNSYVKKCKAEIIQIEPKSIKTKSENIFKSDKIVGEDVTLENVHAKTVKADKVTINKGCHIEHLVCNHLDKLSKKAIVDKIN